MRLPTLPRDDADPGGRGAALERRRSELVWAHDRPAGVATAREVPRGDGYPPRVVAQVMEARARIAVDLGWARLRHPGASSTAPMTPSRLAALYTTLPAPPVAAPAADPTTADRLFAWQRQAGANPYALHAVDTVPADVRLPEGTTADGLARARRLYACDGTHQASLRPADGRVLPAVRSWFTVDDEGQLVPLAIHLPEAVHPDEGLRWALARAAVAAADANEVELYWHLGRAHFLLEAVAVAAGRELSDRHPLAVLLAPHLHGTLAINGAARNDLVVPGGAIDRILGPALTDALAWVRAGVQDFDPAADRFDRDLERRGLAGAPVQSPWRDDGAGVFGALRRWVEGVIDVAYADDATLRADPELRSFVAALRAPDGGRLARVAPVDTREGLADLFLGILWACTAHHAAVHYTQYEQMGAVEVTPAASWGRVPRTVASAPDDAWASVLPPRGAAEEQVRFYVQQSLVRVDTLGVYPRGHFLDPRLQPHRARLAADLAAAGEGIATADARRWQPWPYLHPDRIAASIHV